MHIMAERRQSLSVSPSLRITRPSIASRRRHTSESTPGRTRIERVPDRGHRPFGPFCIIPECSYSTGVRIPTARSASRGWFWFLNGRREERRSETSQVLPWANRPQHAREAWQRKHGR
ncbi:hypothetical protein CGRA01v4_11020 [Colletotrichum graminicola]|nr:hypothetical protein CGRA01v4_11020 [Colletotrichum graminicola]